MRWNPLALLAALPRLVPWVRWAFRRFPDWKRRGRFGGTVGLDWRGPLDYHFRNDGGFRFERGTHPEHFAPSGEVIVPGEMDTDGGSIPRLAWVLPGLDPWTFLPAYLVHDWEFEQHHRNLSGKTLEEANATLAEGVYTLMMDGVAPYSGFDLRLIYDGVSSPVGEDAWANGLKPRAPGFAAPAAADPAEFLKTRGVPRSPRWPALERQLIAAHPYCAACGATTDLVGHHLAPFHLHPERELDPANVLVLCESRPGRSCHCALGHFYDWGRSNPEAVAMAAAFLAALRRAR